MAVDEPVAVVVDIGEHSRPIPLDLEEIVVRVEGTSRLGQHGSQKARQPVLSRSIHDGRPHELFRFRPRVSLPLVAAALRAGTPLLLRFCALATLWRRASMRLMIGACSCWAGATIS